MKTLFRALVAITVLGAAPSFAATTISTNVSVTASIASVCVFDTTPTTAVAFGAYNPLSGTDLDSTAGTIVARCTKNTAYSLALGVGGGTGAAYSTGRFMSNGTDDLEYNLFTDNTYTTVWGDGTDSSDTVDGTGTGIAAAFNQTTTIYGRIPNSQNLSSGSYSDTVTVDLTY
jgi:spore coat protein U-like protein